MEVISYLIFNGNCEEAIHFYAKALDGNITMLMKAGDSPTPVKEDDKNKIMHARLEIGKSVLYFSDAFDTKKVQFGDAIQLSLQPAEVAAAEKYFANLSADGKVIMPLSDTFWGARFGMLLDKFGIRWMVNCELKKQADDDKKNKQ